MSCYLLALPFELRLTIYHLILSDNRRIQKCGQPSNNHTRILRSCRQIYAEASPLMRRYVSLKNETQIVMFLRCMNDDKAKEVRWADVASDGRMLQYLQSDEIEPASHLFLALARMTSLQTLRLFSVRDSHVSYPVSVYTSYNHLPEASMDPPARLLARTPQSYQSLDPSTRVVPCKAIHPASLHTLRLSGDCNLHSCIQTASALTADHPDDSLSLPALKHLSITGITSNAFDNLSFSKLLPYTSLLSFSHAQGHRLGFALCDSHLTSLVPCCTQLRKLVLLGASRLSSCALSSFLRSLPKLEYLALSLVTVNDMRENFILALGDKVQVLKIHMTRAWSPAPVFPEERAICDALEERVLKREYPPEEVCISFHSKLMSKGGRERRWRDIAQRRGIIIKIGPWEDDEEV